MDLQTRFNYIADALIESYSFNFFENSLQFKVYFCENGQKNYYTIEFVNVSSFYLLNTYFEDRKKIEYRIEGGFFELSTMILPRKNVNVLLKSQELPCLENYSGEANLLLDLLTQVAYLKANQVNINDEVHPLNQEKNLSIKVDNEPKENNDLLNNSLQQELTKLTGAEIISYHFNFYRLKLSMDLKITTHGAEDTLLKVEFIDISTFYYSDGTIEDKENFSAILKDSSLKITDISLATVNVIIEPQSESDLLYTRDVGGGNLFLKIDEKLLVLEAAKIKIGDELFEL